MMTIEQYVEKEAKKSRAIEIARTLLLSGVDRERVKKSSCLSDKELDTLFVQKN